MKTILKFLILTVVLLVFVGIFSSCKNKEEPFLTIINDGTPITAVAEGGEYYIAVRSNSEWIAVLENPEDAGWCQFNFYDIPRNGNGAITINIGENSLFTTRSTTIKITSGNLTKSVVVNQEPAEKPEFFLIVDETPIIVTAEGGTYYIAVNSNGAWAAVVENSEPWITLTTNNDTIVVDVDENTFFESRSTTVKITLGSLAKSLVINQEAAEEIDSCLCPAFPKFNLKPTERVSRDEHFKSEEKEIEAIAWSFLQEVYGLNSDYAKLSGTATSPAGRYVYFEQYIGNIPVYMTNFTVFINRDSIVSYTLNEFRNVELYSDFPKYPLISESDALKIAIDCLNAKGDITDNPIINQLVYFESIDKGLELAWQIVISHWEILVSASDGCIIHALSAAMY